MKTVFNYAVVTFLSVNTVALIDTVSSRVFIHLCSKMF